MAIEQELLNKVKTNLRISHSVLDNDLADTIEVCLLDLKVCGVQDPDATDPLILNAVKLYSRAAYTDDTEKAAAYQARYDSLKACLMMASGYREEAAAGD